MDWKKKFLQKFNDSGIRSLDFFILPKDPARHVLFKKNCPPNPNLGLRSAVVYVKLNFPFPLETFIPSRPFHIFQEKLKAGLWFESILSLNFKYMPDCYSKSSFYSKPPFYSNLPFYKKSAFYSKSPFS